MLWACLLAYVTGMVNQELLQRNEYLGEGDKVTLARREVAPRLGRQAQENLAATANPGTILGLVKFMQLYVGRSCEAPS
jgi:hypothetical protein